MWNVVLPFASSSNLNSSCPELVWTDSCSSLNMQNISDLYVLPSCLSKETTGQEQRRVFVGASITNHQGALCIQYCTLKITIDAKQGALSLTGLQWNIVDRAQGSAAGSSEQSVHSAEEDEDEEEAAADQKSPVLVFN